MRSKTRVHRDWSEDPWERWFAWRPVYVTAAVFGTKGYVGWWVWWQYVERQWKYSYDGWYVDGYRLVPDGEEHERPH